MAQERKKPTPAQEAERKRETSKAANKALRAQREAKRLTQAAAAAGDPDERQKLLNQALEKEVEAENFGKTAKYLQTGAFQGLCAGAGLGGSVGVWLGVVTGTLVGGTTGLVTGGIGAGIGLGVGAMHGPWFKVGELMGEGIRKITGDIPGWKATEEQKATLEKMVNGVREQERPDEEELMQLSTEGGKVEAGKAYVGQRKEDERRKGVLQGDIPAMATAVNPMSSAGARKNASRAQPKSKVANVPANTAQSDNDLKTRYGALAGQAVTPSPQVKSQNSAGKRKPRKLEVRSAKAGAG